MFTVAASVPSRKLVLKPRHSLARVDSKKTGYSFLPKHMIALGKSLMSIQYIECILKLPLLNSMSFYLHSQMCLLLTAMGHVCGWNKLHLATFRHLCLRSMFSNEVMYCYLLHDSSWHCFKMLHSILTKCPCLTKAKYRFIRHIKFYNMQDCHIQPSASELHNKQSSCTWQHI